MILWIDAQLSPQLAPWPTATISIPAQSVSSLRLRDASDLEIFQSARNACATIMSKDQDFVNLVAVHGASPKSFGSLVGTRQTPIFAPSPTNVPNSTDASAIR